MIILSSTDFRSSSTIFTSSNTH